MLKIYAIQISIVVIFSLNIVFNVSANDADGGIVMDNTKSAKVEEWYKWGFAPTDYKPMSNEGEEWYKWGLAPTDDTPMSFRGELWYRFGVEQRYSINALDSIEITRRKFASTIG